MSDYELVTLFYQINGNMSGTMANLMTITFAMLTAGYLVAHRLDRAATSILVVIFSGAMFGMSNEARGLASDMALVGREITARAASDPTSGVAWHPAANGMDFGFIWPVTLGLCVLLYGGTLWFFFRSRASGGVGFSLTPDAG